MLAAVRWMAVIIGVGVGSLTATVVALVAWVILEAAGVDGAPQAGLTVGIMIGFAASGYVAGRMAPVVWRFHGALAGLALAGLVLVIARLGGSPAPTPSVLLLAVFGIVVGGTLGTIGGRIRRHTSRPSGIS